MSDGTKDVSLNAGTFAGNVAINGNTTVGNASSDTFTVTASLASTINIGTTATYDLGSATLGMRAIYFGGNSQTVNVKGSGSMSATWTMTLPVSAGTNGYYLKTDGSGVTSWAPHAVPTVQTFTSGTSQTYTTPANVRYIIVKAVGGGGGGGGVTTGTGYFTGTTGGNTSFNSVVANGGVGGQQDIAGTGGTGGSGTATVRISGSPGGPGSGFSTDSPGGNGGNAPYFCGGGSGGVKASAGGGAVANTGGGGGGSGGSTVGTAQGTGGGGSGEYFELFIDAPASSYTYSVGGSGAGGAGTRAGGAGAAGKIIVLEYY